MAMSRSEIPGRMIERAASMPRSEIAAARRM
jgi:hypothetical protein